MNEKQPMFSVIMACYNHGQYVETAIKSILDQTFQDFELIVADNGSTDGSWEVIRKYSERIKTFRLEENDFEKCTEMMMQLTTGKYLAQMSSDDYWYPEKLEVQVKAIEENPHCYAYFTWAAFTDADLRITEPDLFSYQNRNRYEWFKTIYHKGTVLAIGTMVTVNDKEKWLKYSKGVLNYRQLPDQMVFLKMLLNGDDIYVVPKIEMKIRRHDNCIGANTLPVQIRAINENISIWSELWESMPDDFFLKAFNDDLYDKCVVDRIQIQCERMLVFLKLSQTRTEHQAIAINYFTKHYCDEGVADVLLNKYHYTRESFFEITGKNGIGVYWQQNLLYWQQYKKIGVAKALYSCNKILSNLAVSALAGDTLGLFVSEFKNYMDMELEMLDQEVFDIHPQSREELMRELEEFETTNILDLDKICVYLDAGRRRLLEFVL